MKKYFKGISKKLLSCTLAIAVILCSMAVTLSVLADGTEGDPYPISYSSPAIPMFSGKAVDLNNVTVQFAKGGTPVSGADIIWSTAETEKITLDAQNKLLTANSVTNGSPVKITATSSSGTKDIYIVINAEGDYNFKIVEADFSGKGTYDNNNFLYTNVASSNITSHKSDKVFTRKAIPTSNEWSLKLPTADKQYIAYYGDLAMILYRADILLNFDDYTVNTELQFSGTSAGISGLTLKTNFDFSTAEGTTFYMNTGGMYIGQATNYTPSFGQFGTSSNYHTGTNGWGYFNMPAHTLANDEWKNTLPGAANLAEWTIRNGTGAAARKVAVEFYNGGQEFKYVLDAGETNAKTIIDTASSAPAIIANGSNVAKTAGYLDPGIEKERGNSIGFITFATQTKVYALSASLNVKDDSDMPKFASLITDDIAAVGEIPVNTRFNLSAASYVPDASQGEIYPISYSSPAIPMFSGKAVDLNNVTVQFTKGGAPVSGADIIWSTAETEKITLDAQNKLLTANSVTNGSPVKITATSSSGTKDIYIVINAEGDYNFKIVEADFSGNGTYNNDNFIYATSTGNAATFKSDGLFKRVAIPTTNNEWSLKVPTTDKQYFAYYNSNMAVLLYRADILSAFADYKVDAELKFSQDPGSEQFSGLVLKANVDFENIATGSTFKLDNGGMYLFQRKYYTPSFGQFYTASYHTMANGFGFCTMPATTLESAVAKTVTTASDSDLDEWTIRSGATESARTVSVEFFDNGEEFKYVLDAGKNNAKTIIDTSSDSKYIISNNAAVDKSSTANYFKNGIEKESGNTIGFIASKQTMVYALSASLNVKDDSNMPEMFVPVQDEKVSGTDFVWKTESALCEISEGYLIVYSTGEAQTIVGTTQDGVTVTLTLDFVAAGTQTNLKVEQFADANIAIGKADTKYIFTVSDTVNLIPGSFEVLEGTNKLFSFDITDNSGKAFEVVVEKPHIMTVNARFAADENELLSNSYMMGASINKDTSGIRFATVIPSLRKSGESDIAFVKPTVNGEEVTIDAAGTLLLPTELLGANGFADYNEQQLNAAIDAYIGGTGSQASQIDVNGKNGAKAQNVVIHNLYKSTEEFSLAFTTLNKIPESYKSINISCISYIRYTDAEGNKHLVFSEKIDRTYNDIYNVLYPSVQ